MSLKIAHYIVFVLDRICRAYQKRPVLVAFRVQGMLMVFSTSLAFTVVHSLIFELTDTGNFLVFLFVSIPILVWATGKWYDSYQANRKHAAQFRAYPRVMRFAADALALTFLVACGLSPMFIFQ